MNDNNEQNGLFSDEYETPKRVNPYLKKNKEKTKAEKPKREKKTREADSPYVAAADDKPAPADPHAYDTPPSYEDPDREVGYTHKRTFSDWMFEHVKLIATIATIIVVLSLVLITDVVSIAEKLITQAQQADSEPISLNYIYGLTQKSDPIQWRDLEKFRHEVSKADDSVTWKLEVGDTQYELWVSGADMSKPPSDIWLIDWNTGDRMILGEDDLEQFLAAHNQK